MCVEFHKHFFDLASESPGMAVTWMSGRVGTHGGNAGYFLSGVSEHMDEFLVDYLRVNEEACE